jgi:phosphatidylserine decarboxylase
MPIAREGWSYIAVLFLLGAIAWVLSWPWLAGVLLALGLFTSFFFRDPDRSIPENPRLVVSPADGRVMGVVPAQDEPGSTRVSIFLSIFDVHVNRAPISGRIAGVEYRRGEFLAAFNPEASLRNEQNKVTLVDGDLRLSFKQIAGLIARRIVFRKSVDDEVIRGERVGLIKFGSRVDVVLPQQVEIRVKVGDRVRGGTSIIGERR